MNSLCIRNRTFAYDDFTKDSYGIYSREAMQENVGEKQMDLTQVNIGEEYIVKEIALEDEELKNFLFSLGCYSGEPITVISRLKSGCIVSIKDGRYSVDNGLAKSVIV